MTVKIKQYGEMRTGTCYLKVLLEKNFRNLYVSSNWLGWKHARPRNDAVRAREKGQLSFLVLVKDPFAWMWSILQGIANGYGKMLHASSRHPHNDYRLQKELVARWNRNYKAWLTCDIKIRYEGLIMNYRRILQRVEKQLKLSRKKKHLHDIHAEVLPGEHVVSRAFSRRKFYVKRGYLKQLQPKTRKIIELGVDWDVMKEYGYAN